MDETLKPDPIDKEASDMFEDMGGFSDKNVEAVEEKGQQQNIKEAADRRKNVLQSNLREYNLFLNGLQVLLKILLSRLGDRSFEVTTRLDDASAILSKQLDLKQSNPRLTDLRDKFDEFLRTNPGATVHDYHKRLIAVIGDFEAKKKEAFDELSRYKHEG
jgi:hypothetical protein